MDWEWTGSTGSNYERSREREERRREDWSDRDWERGRERRSRDYRDYERSRRERFSPPRHELSPPQKRLRRDWSPIRAVLAPVRRFRSKYHPDEAGRRQQEAQAALRNRLGVFLYLWEHGWFDNLLLDIDRAPQIIKTLDAAVIKMEGGTEHDLRILEQEEEEERADKAEGPKKEEPRPPEPPGKGPPERPEGDDSAKAEGAEPGAEPAAGAGPEEEEGPDKGPKAEEGDKEGGAKARPRQRSRDSEDGDSDSGDSEGTRRGQPHKDGEGPQIPQIPQTPLCPQLCKRYPGFMRVALSEPQPERRFFRRGWVTFDRSVNIKEICWSLQNIRLRECELSPGVNRDLTRRVRNVSGLTQHRPIVRHDIKLAARLVQALDARARLWSPPGATTGDTAGDSA
ncbi:serrate RNA effector molecule homolog, partial [Passer montanus]|uniref:serrate RNA effector molecule homolog n=1 Tax=Passer montanus TaxID=9160 RepID=UPI0019612AC2